MYLVAIVARAQRLLWQQLEGKGGQLLASEACWLLRPNMENGPKTSKVQQARGKAALLGSTIGRYFQETFRRWEFPAQGCKTALPTNDQNHFVPPDSSLACVCKTIRVH